MLELHPSFFLPVLCAGVTSEVPQCGVVGQSFLQLTDQQQHKQAWPKAGCSTYFVHSLHLTTELCELEQSYMHVTSAGPSLYNGNMGGPIHQGLLQRMNPAGLIWQIFNTRRHSRGDPLSLETGHCTATSILPHVILCMVVCVTNKI